LKLIIGITGSTGAIYGVRMLEVLKKLNVETHLIISEWGSKCISMETEFSLDYVKSLATTTSDEKNMASSISSGTYKIDGMIVAPCSMKTLSAIANGYDDTLVARAAGIRESLLEKVIKMGDKFVAAVKKEYAPGIIGPFSLQSVITKDLELIVYDVSLRVPGNPIVATTSPYTKYQYGQTFGVGRRIAMEIKRAQEEDRLDEIVT